MNISEVIKNRTSLRVYDDRMIEDQDLEKILEAASLAPTAGNQQLYSIIVIKSQETKDKLSESCDHQPFIAKAPVLLLFVSDIYDSVLTVFYSPNAQHRRALPPQICGHALCGYLCLPHFKAPRMQIQIKPLRALEHWPRAVLILLIGKQKRQLHIPCNFTILRIHAISQQHIRQASIRARGIKRHIVERGIHAHFSNLSSA